MVVNENTELRKLRPAEFYNLALILNVSENWKKLVSSVTQEGTENVPKFPGECIEIIEQASRQDRKPAAVIFLEEWATMGRKRPTIGLLLALLMKLELFRAADYLAKDILKVEAPQRPTSGPAVPVDTEQALVDLLKRQNLEARAVYDDSSYAQCTTSEIRLSRVDYPMSMLDTETSISNNNFSINVNNIGVIQVQYDESRSNQVLDHPTLLKISGAENDENNFSNKTENPESSNGLKDDHKPLENNDEQCWNDSQISDLMKFSVSNISEELEGRSRFHLIKFDSAKIDLNRNKENKIIEMSDADLPNFNILSPHSSVERERSIKLEGNRDCEDKRVNKNYEVVPISELTSAELPATLGKFGAPEYFHRELMTTELPLCINDRDGFWSSELNSVRKISPVVSSLLFISGLSESATDSSISQTTDNTVTQQPEVTYAVPRHQITKINNTQNNSVSPGYESVTRVAYNSQELPVTVLEFHKR